MDAPSILIVDDEKSILQTLGGLLADEGFEVFHADNGYDALKRVETESPDLVLLDIWLPGMDGLEVLQEIKKRFTTIPVIMITGHGNIETAIRAIKLGAYDLIEKPLSFDRVLVETKNALNFKRLQEEIQYLRKKTMDKNTIDGQSPITQKLKKDIMAAALADPEWIFLQGEHGTGKELVVRAIHTLSPRASKDLVAVSCSAASDELMEDDLFGHEKGAFEGATSKKIGKLERANEGTLFLDEITNMSFAMQGVLLRVLEEKQFSRIGGNRVIPFTARIIAATNMDVQTAIKTNRLRAELYYRLNVIPVHIPALRDRIDDLPILTASLIKEFSGGITGVTDGAMKMLQQYSWPGNVRELKNLIRRLDAIGIKGNIDVEDLPAPYNPTANTDLRSALKRLPLRQALDTFEKTYIQQVVNETADISEAAKILGISKTAIQKKIKS